MKKLILSALALTTLFACGGGSTNDATRANDSTATSLSGSIQIDGSSTVFPISEAVAEEFRAVQPDVKVPTGQSGTGGGFKKFIRSEIDICDASRPIKKGEAHECDSLNIKYVELEVAKDGLAIVVSKENTWLKDITVAELKMLWESAAQGKITKWNQVRKTWPNEPIKLFGAGTASGTFDYFTEAINGKQGDCRGDYTASEDDNVLVQGVSTDKNALAFFGLAYYEASKDKLNLVAVDNGAGAILPTTETVMNGTYAPLARPLFIYVNGNAAKRAEVVTFTNFYLDKASALAQEVGYIALTPEKITEQKTKFEAFLKELK